MKTLKTLFSVAFLAVATSMSASNVVENTPSAIAVDGGNSYSKVFVSYNASKMSFDYEGAESLSYPGFSVGYMYGFGVAKNLPLFVEAGAALQYRSYTDKESTSVDEDGFDGEFKTKENIFSLNIPVNLVYKFKINEDITIDPFVGIDLRYNISGKNKLTYSGDMEDEVNEYLEEEGNEVDLFKGDDAYKRFQAGWHIGVGATWKNLNLSVSYGTDFSEIYEKTKFKTTMISLGYNF